MVSSLSKMSRRGSEYILGPVPPTEKTSLEPMKEKVVTMEELEEIVHQAKQSVNVVKEYDLKKKARILKETLQSTYDATEALLEVVESFKGAYESGRAEERFAWALAVQNCSELLNTYKKLAKGKKPKPESFEKHQSGRTLATVFPSTIYEHLLFAGYKQEIWFQEGKEPGQLTYDTLPDPKLLLLLASGNQTPLVGCDILHIVFVENSVCICKLNPVNDYIRPVLEMAFKPLLDNQLLFLVNGGIPVSQALCHAEAVQAIHM